MVRKIYIHFPPAARLHTRMYCLSSREYFSGTHSPSTRVLGHISSDQSHQDNPKSRLPTVSDYINPLHVNARQNHEKVQHSLAKETLTSADKCISSVLSNCINQPLLFMTNIYQTKLDSRVLVKIDANIYAHWSKTLIRRVLEPNRHLITNDIFYLYVLGELYKAISWKL